jgi:hypothetical protein
MAATIKPIDGKSVRLSIPCRSRPQTRRVNLTFQVHQIQSGQVIVDLCSVVKELLENSVDAGATVVGICNSPHLVELCEPG